MKNILRRLEEAYRAQAPTIRLSLGGVGIASLPEQRDVDAEQAEINACMEQLQDLIDAVDILRESGHLTLAEESSPIATARGILRTLDRRNEMIVALQGDLTQARSGPATRLPEAEQAKLLEGEPYFILRAGVAGHARLVERIDSKEGARQRAWFDENIGPKPGQEWIRKGKPETVFAIWGAATNTSGEGFQINDARTVIYFDKAETGELFTSLRQQFIAEFEPAPTGNAL